MKTMRFIRLLPLFLLFLCGPALAQDQPDYEGSKDYPDLSRMPAYFIASYEEKEFDAYNFDIAEDKKESVEGHFYRIEYNIREGKKNASELQIIRNYENAVTAKGGKVIFDGLAGGQRHATLRLAKDKTEVTIEVMPFDEGTHYALTIVEREAMKQDVSYQGILDELNASGHVVISVNFDTGKAAIRPESQKTIDDVAAMLKAQPNMSLLVEGHTDNVGKPDKNKELSRQRAEAVKAALVKAGVAAGRLEAAGFGQEKPVADNSTEAGRAKNRRVELRKK